MDHDSPNQNTDSSQPDNIGNFLKSQSKKNKLIISLAVFGLILFILVASMATFKDQIFQALYPKPTSEAVDPIDDLTSQLLEADKAYDQALQQSGQTVFQEATPSASPSASPSAVPTPQPVSTSSAVQAETTSDEVQQRLDSMKGIAQRRKDLLLQKLKENPQEFLNKATLVDKRGDFPESVRPYIEKNLKIQGRLIIIHIDDFDNKISKQEYELSTLPDQKTYSIYFVKDAPSLAASGATADIAGKALEQQMVVEKINILIRGVQSGRQVLGVQATGAKKIAVLMFNFANDQRQPFSKEQITSKLFTDQFSIDKYYRENSNNQLSFTGDIFGWYTVPTQNNETCLLNSALAAEVNDIAIRDGVNLTNYDILAYFYPFPATASGQCKGPAADPSNNRVWYSSLQSHVLAHEIGHILGLGHANFFNCRPEQIDEISKCRDREYEDVSDVMGSFPALFHFNAPHKIATGWISSDKIRTISEPGQYTVGLVRFGSSTPGYQILKIPKPGPGRVPGFPEDYYVSFRNPVGFDSGIPEFFKNGASIHFWSGFPGVQTEIIDTTPASPDVITNDAPLSDGATFNDPMGVSITQVSHDNNTVTLSVNLNLSPSPSPPTPTPTPVPQKLPPCEIYGDLNLDGTVTVADTEIVSKIVDGLIIPQVSTSGDTQYMSKVGDVNGDNSITSSDALLIDRYIQNLDATFKVCTNAKPPACNNLGDVTTNGNVTPMDAYEALRIAVGYKDSLYTKKPYTDDQKRRADVDGNGNVTSTDALRISRYVAGTITTFPACSRRVFVTSAFYNGNLGGLSGADQKCQERANAANLGGTWMAWLSDSTNSPSTRFSETLRSITSPVTFKLVDNATVIASSWNDLIDGSLQNPINKTEQNTPQSGSRVWTNTKFNGGVWQSDPTKNCQNWTQIGPISGYTGVNNATNFSWTEVAGFNYCGVDAAPIYCFEL